jgi:beta-lactam-binding protein with PASTA domain
MPSFKGMTVPELEQLLQGKDVRVQYFHQMQELGPDHSCITCRVVDQQPAVGAMVDLGKTLTVQLDLSLSAPAA